jgi:hypothetical protein
MSDQLQLGMDPRAELDAKISRLLYGGAGDRPEISAEARELLVILQKHMGLSNAIWISRLAERLGLSPREVKAAARELVVKLKLPVVGSRQAPYGYYLAINAEELRHARNVLRSEIRALTVRLIALGEEVQHIHAAVGSAARDGAADELEGDAA